MKKNLVLVFVGLIVVFVGGLCLRHYLPDLKGPHIPVNSEETTPQSEMIEGISNEEILLSAGTIVLDYLSQGKIFALKEVIATEGLTFLPYPNDGSSNSHQTFGIDRMNNAEFLEMSESLVRGNWDGSDEEIEMTTKEYYERFIWDQNYGEAPEIFVGDKIVNRGNTLVNLGELYSGTQIIEYHFPGFDEEYAGMDWKSLYVVFVEEDGGLFLRAIAHGEWTI